MRTAFAFALVLVLAACNSGGSSSGGGGNPPPAGTTITFTVTGNAPVAAAVKKGSGNWSSLSMNGVSGSFVLPTGMSTYGVAVVCNSIFEYIALLSTNDTISPSIPCPSTGTLSTTVTYDVTGIAGATNAKIFIGNAVSFQNTAAGVASFSNAPSGTQDVAALAFAASGTDALAVKIVRGVNVTSAGIGPVTAVAGTDNTSIAGIALNGVPSGYTSQVNAIYVTAGGASLLIKNAGNTMSYPTVASADVASGDYYNLEAFASLNASSSISQVGEVETFPAAQSVSFSLPAPMTYTPPAPAQYPTFAVPSYSGFSVSGSTTYQFSALAPLQNEILVGTTSSYLASVGSTFAFPNLSNITGFLSEPASGHPEDWLAGIVTSSAGPTYFLAPQLPNNATLEWALAGGQFMVP